MMARRQRLGTPAFCGKLFLVLLAAPALRAAAPQSEELPGRFRRPPVLYYDYLENGELKGGQISIDKTNPHQTLVGPIQRTEAGWTPIIENGPSDNRIDLVFVGDGFQASELGLFDQQIHDFLPEFFNEVPMRQYASYFNVYKVDVVSQDSGVDHDPVFPLERDTALDMGFSCFGIDRLLCVDVSKAQGFAANAPGQDLVMAIANSSKYGGAGYSSLSTFSGGNGNAFEIALHEIGHSFANLADEYDYSDGATYTGGELQIANVSIYDAAELLLNQTKWYRWLGRSAVDAFEGARYFEFGLNRPTSSSKMRNLGRPFQAVNVEQFVLSLYNHVRPIDEATPPGTYYGHDTVLEVTPLQPLDHDLDCQWFLDGSPIAGATGREMQVGSLGLDPGIYRIWVEVIDGTRLVRDEVLRAWRMHDVRGWDVVVPEPALVIDDDHPAVLDPVTLTVLGGSAGAPGQLLIVAVNGQPHLVPVAQGRFDANREWSLTALIPSGLAGVELTVQALAVTSDTGIRASNPAMIQIQGGP